MDIKWIICNYNHNPTKLVNILNKKKIIIYDHSTKPNLIPKKIKKLNIYFSCKNYGFNLVDYFNFIIENYNRLPEFLGFIKGNIVPRHIDKRRFLIRIKKKGFVPLYSCGHLDKNENFQEKNSNIISRFLRNEPKFIAQQTSPGLYSEFTNNWYARKLEKGKFFETINDLHQYLFNRDAPRYITFVPGGCMIVRSEIVRQWTITVYKKLYKSMTYKFFPVEAYHIERSMLYMFEYPRK